MPPCVLPSWSCFSGSCSQLRTHSYFCGPAPSVIGLSCGWRNGASASSSRAVFMAAQDILHGMWPILPQLLLAGSVQLTCAHVLAPDGEHWTAARITIEDGRIRAV